MKYGWLILMLGAGIIAAAPATKTIAQEKQKSPIQQAQVQPAVALKPEALYQGWRVSQLIGQEAVSKTGTVLGKVRNVIIDDNGIIRGIIVHGTHDGASLDFAYRIPWEAFEKDKLPGRVVADISDARQPLHGLFPRNETINEKEEFRLTEILGEYARLQPGFAYGYVTDVVFTDQGSILAILVTRDASSGGGTYAFGFPATMGRWSPRLSYYGLPYITAEQATSAGLQVDLRRFAN